jgi:hypothetical protein
MVKIDSNLLTLVIAGPALLGLLLGFWVGLKGDREAEGDDSAFTLLFTILFVVWGVGVLASGVFTFLAIVDGFAEGVS